MDLSALNSLMLGAMDPTTLGPSDMREGFLLNYPLAVEAEHKRMLETGMPSQLVDRLAWMSVVLTTAVNGRTEDRADLGSVVSVAFDTETEEWRLTRNDKLFLILKSVPHLHTGAWSLVWAEGRPVASLRAEMDQLTHVRATTGSDFLDEVLNSEYLFALSEGAVMVRHDISVMEDVYAIQYTEDLDSDVPDRYLIVTFPKPESE
ncbi:hypothetical protein [Stenotrophomonas sp. GD03657]|uniref:hypothetical protein n=1 Tax=Stenotrophomonas sp. GD03657 TaxID=2975363 RepID=UPI00244CD255|nr:hypothetical protein [Stenotrophomonas sp. GD03657]MDH2154150.1 hypothetical protein [Stenotrophomonas sp. GD03657]